MPPLFQHWCKRPSHGLTGSYCGRKVRFAEARASSSPRVRRSPRTPFLDSFRSADNPRATPLMDISAFQRTNDPIWAQAGSLRAFACLDYCCSTCAKSRRGLADPLLVAYPMRNMNMGCQLVFPISAASVGSVTRGSPSAFSISMSSIASLIGRAAMPREVARRCARSINGPLEDTGLTSSDHAPQ